MGTNIKSFRDLAKDSSQKTTERLNEISTIFNYNGNNITFVDDNGHVYVNMTHVAKSFPNKNLSKILRSREISEYVSIFSRITNVQPTDLVIIMNGGSNSGTWVHSKIAIRVAQKLSPEFAIWVDNNIEELLTKGHVSLPNFNDPVAAARAWADEMERRKLAEAKIEEDRPKVVFAETALKVREGEDVLVRDARKRLESHGYIISEDGFREYLVKTNFLTRGKYNRWEVTSHVIKKNFARYRYVDGFKDVFTVVITEKGFQAILRSLSIDRWFHVFEDCGGYRRNDSQGSLFEDNVFSLDFR